MTELDKKIDTQVINALRLLTSQNVLSNVSLSVTRRISRPNNFVCRATIESFNRAHPLQEVKNLPLYICYVMDHMIPVNA